MVAAAVVGGNPKVSKLWPDYVAFTREALRSRDVDPVYPVMEKLVEKQDPESALWMSVLYLTYYHMGSALAVWEETLEPRLPDRLGGLPTATERRGNREVFQLERNLRGWLDAADRSGGLLSYLWIGLPEDPGAAWEAVQERIRAVPGNGRWASYKYAEILQKVHGWELKPLHMGHAYSTGPRQGLALLTRIPIGNGPDDIVELDRLSNLLVDGLRRNGVDVKIEEAETTLCDFHALCEGRYYVGYDIDQMQAQLTAVPSDMTDEAFQARFETLPHRYLGEHGGWAGVDRERAQVYRRTGKVVTR